MAALIENPHLPGFSLSGDIDRLLKTLGYAYALRVPLLLFLTAALLTWGGLVPGGPGSSILRGVYDTGLPSQAGYINALRFAMLSFTALAFAATLTLTSWIIMTAGRLRFNYVEIPNTPGIRVAAALPGLTLALFILAGCSARSYQPGWAVLGDLLGAIVFAAFLFGGSALAKATSLAGLEPYARMLVAAVIVLSKRDKWSVGIAAALTLSIAFSRLPFERLIPGDTSGYVRGNELMGRHRFAASLTGASVAAYLIIWFLKRDVGNVSGSTYPVFPTLALLLLLGILVCWLFSGLTFFLDRYHVPLMLPIVLYASFASSFPQSDHFYHGLPVTHLNKPYLPEDALKAAQGKPVVLVAATGGGIQAAAWSARVLRELQLASQGRTLDFAHSVKLVSAVSGGAVGAMYFVNAYAQFELPGEDHKPCGPKVKDIDRDCVIQAAETSSLDEVASGLVYEDAVLGLFPFLKGLDYDGGKFRLENGRGLMLDRGNALENALKRVPGVNKALLAWKAETRDSPDHWRPAVIFNATVVENGERLLFSTTDLDDQTACLHRDDPEEGRKLFSAARNNGRVDFHRLYCNSDVSIATAARLSATFPYVSPAARIQEGDLHWPANHIVDGGYFDNYGMASLVEWLQRALHPPAQGDAGEVEAERPPPVMVIEIRSSPEGEAGAPGGRRGFVFQALHPVTTLLSVRDTGQFSHAQLELNLLKEEKATRNICSAIFQYVAPRDRGRVREEPLSWHLTPEDIADLKAAWKQQKEVDKVLDFLKDGSCRH